MENNIKEHPTCTGVTKIEVITRFLVIQNVYRICIENDVRVFYPSEVLSYNTASYEFNDSTYPPSWNMSKVIKIGKITDLSCAVDNIAEILSEIINSEKYTTTKQLREEICRDLFVTI